MGAGHRSSARQATIVSEKGLRQTQDLDELVRLARMRSREVYGIGPAHPMPIVPTAQD
jgi:hypothetical protein